MLDGCASALPPLRPSIAERQPLAPSAAPSATPSAAPSVAGEAAAAPPAASVCMKAERASRIFAASRSHLRSTRSTRSSSSEADSLSSSSSSSDPSSAGAPVRSTSILPGAASSSSSDSITVDFRSRLRSGSAFTGEGRTAAACGAAGFLSDVSAEPACAAGRGAGCDAGAGRGAGTGAGTCSAGSRRRCSAGTSERSSRVRLFM
mmetsp:Transcript_9787/g.23557  ORF Transcript_9787/g.23557 Transcript_9787/m.23557 type:complete len:205 (-) Transcript_9787:392-1006(-)